MKELRKRFRYLHRIVKPMSIKELQIMESLVDTNLRRAINRKIRELDNRIAADEADIYLSDLRVAALQAQLIVAETRTVELYRKQAVLRSKNW